jgi:hypothetical protein
MKLDEAPKDMRYLIKKKRVRQKLYSKSMEMYGFGFIAHNIF